MNFRSTILYILHVKLRVIPWWWLMHDSFFEDLHNMARLEAKSRGLDNVLKQLDRMEQQLKEEEKFIEANR